MKGKRMRTEAFTLVEVVVAMAVLSFCLVVLLGLLDVGLNNAKKSNQDMAMASMVWEVANNLRCETNLASSFQTNYYFDQAGSSTNQIHAYYSCLVTTNTPSVATVSQTLDTNLIIATVQFTWPATVIPPPHTNLAYATIPPP